MMWLSWQAWSVVVDFHLNVWLTLLNYCEWPTTHGLVNILSQFLNAKVQPYFILQHTCSNKWSMWKYIYIYMYFSTTMIPMPLQGGCWWDPKATRSQKRYVIDYKNCEKMYTMGKFNLRVKEHQGNMWKRLWLIGHSQRVRRGRKVSAITDHACQDYHIIDWDRIRMVETEVGWKVKGIKKAIMNTPREHE